ncbi:uncharacterized protein BO96DRAFT_54422 [Aspergillus niger CBS 101883]|uniref:uncharacterized protein n=1 Tax=Aspergillus lacticoffeatus (strain CBS 101883) TaxID=1450533 RepID=UPI000D7FB6E9|nr:uncharacterized protein BO96DRAFT_54422 [Aspergillus niger CBS 101883]PYH56277.1 hypothetical protein BO96DRAFT_54422 [Aspergillus niger CBS 101883]
MSVGRTRHVARTPPPPPPPPLLPVKEMGKGSNTVTYQSLQELISPRHQKVIDSGGQKWGSLFTHGCRDNDRG